MHEINSRSQDNSDSMFWQSKLHSVGNSRRILLSHLHQRWRWAHACKQNIAGVAGEWWWDSNECASLPKEGPLGPVLKQSRSRLWVTRWATVSKCGNVTGFGTCMAVPGCGKIDKMSNGKVYGGHIMVHHPWGKWLLGQCAWCRLGEAKD